MLVQIKITGLRGCGKTRLKGYLLEAIQRQQRETGQLIDVGVEIDIEVEIDDIGTCPSGRIDGFTNTGPRTCVQV